MAQYDTVSVVRGGIKGCNRLPNEYGGGGHLAEYTDELILFPAFHIYYTLRYSRYSTEWTNSYHKGVRRTHT